MDYLKFPLFITWSITSNCNLRCKHCFRSEYECNELDQNAIDRFTDLFIEKKVNRIILTGGEPLTNKNLFYIVSKLCGKIKIGIATNGVLLNEEIITRLVEYKVKDFQISLDGATEYYNDFIRGKGIYKKVIENIKLLKRHNCKVTIAMTVNSFNYDDILNNSINLINELGLKKLRIEYYIPINKNKFIVPISIDKMNYLENELMKNKGDINLQLPRFDSSVNCGAGIYNCVLNSDLTISPCDLLTHIYHSKKINDIKLFQKYWQEDESFVEWRKKIHCMSCDNKYRCLAIRESKNE